MNFPLTASFQWQYPGLWQQLSAAISPVQQQDDGIERYPDICFEMLERETAGHNTGQDSVSCFPQANILETDTPTAVAKQPGKKRNGKGVEYSKNYRDKSKNSGQGQGQRQQFSAAISTPVPEQDDGRQGFPDIYFEMLESETAGHNTGQDSGSGLPQAIILETDTPTAVAQQPSKKKNGKGAEYSKNYRDKNKKLKQEMEDKIAKLREENEEHKRNIYESNKKMDVLRVKIRLLKVRSAEYKKAYDSQQIQVNSQLEIMSYMQQENTRLKAENDLLIQQLSAESRIWS